MAYVPPHLYQQRVSKAKLRTWLMEHGHWQRFVEIRESLKSQGVDGSDAWGQAASVLESELGSGEPTDQVKEVDPKPKPSPMPSMQVQEVDMDGDKVGKRSFMGRSCSTPETVEWVAAHVMIVDASPEDAPSPEAWGMLCWARRSNTNEAQFWGQIYTKLLPSRTSLEADSRYRDDGRRLSGLIDLLQMEDDNGKNETKQSTQSDREVDTITNGGSSEVGDEDAGGSSEVCDGDKE